MKLNSLKMGVAATLTILGLAGAAGTASAQHFHRPAGPVNASSFQHIDRLAQTLERQTQDLHREIDAHFRRSPVYQHLHEDVEQMERAAQHIHEVIHREPNISHLRSDVERLDRLFHHVEELVNRLGHFGGIDPHAYNHFRRSLRQIEATLHHLQSDLRRLDHDDCPYRTPSRPLFSFQGFLRHR